MNKLILGICAMAFAVPAVCLAGGPPKGQVGAFVVNSGFDDGSVDDDGTGFGVRGWVGLNPNWFVHGEYQSVETDDFEVSLDTLRAGGGYAGDLGGGTMWLGYAEYVDFGSDMDQAGFGLHGGIILGVGSPFSFYGTLGYLTTDDTDGLEIDVGADFMLNEAWSVGADYRIYMGSVDPSGDLDLTSLRAGVSYSFY